MNYAPTDGYSVDYIEIRLRQTSTHVGSGPLTKCRLGAKRMNTLVNDLLLLSRLENDKQIAKIKSLICLAMNQLYDDRTTYNIDYGHTLSIPRLIDSPLRLEVGTGMELAGALDNLIAK